MTRGIIASTAHGRPWTGFSRISHFGKSVKIGLHKGSPLTPFYLKIHQLKRTKFIFLGSIYANQNPKMG